MLTLLRSLADRVDRLVARLAWLPGLGLRLVLGATFVRTGWGKLHSLDQVTAYFASLGIPAASVQAPVVAALELVGGLLLLAGLGTRVAAALLTGVMTVALATAIVPAADGVITVLGSLEAIYLAALVHLAVHGAGAVSLDRLAAAGRRSASPARAPAIVTVQGATS